MKNLNLFRLCLLFAIFSGKAQIGDACSNPYTVSLDDPITVPCSFQQISSLDFNNFNSDAGVPNPGCSYGATNYDLWVKVTIPSNSDGFKITIDSTVSTDNDYRNFMAATYTGTDCNTLSYRTCKTTSRSSVYNNYFDGFTPGETVYVRIYRKNSTSGTWDKPFFLRITATNTINSEDACSKARPLIPGTYCNYTSTDKNENDNNAPDKLTSTDNICQPGNLPFGSYDNNQWYYFEILPSTPQPFEILINNVSCTAGDQVLQVAIWKTTAYNCANWTNGYELSDASAAGDGDLVACAVGSGTVSISRTLPPGRYWYTIDGSAGAFCRYDIATTIIPPLPILFLNASLNNNTLSWFSLDDSQIRFYLVQSSLDGFSFTTIDTLESRRFPGMSSYQSSGNFTAPYYRISAYPLSAHPLYSPILSNHENILGKFIETTITPDGTLLIRNRSSEHSITPVSVYDIAGKQLLSATLIPNQQIEFRGLESLVILKLDLPEGYWTKKIALKKY